MSKTNSVTWIALETESKHHNATGWWCSECLDICRQQESQKDYTADWLNSIWLWTVQFTEMTVAITAALAMGLFGLIVSALWILHCFFEGVDSDFRIYQANLKARDGLDLEERDNLQSEHKSLLAQRERLLLQIDQIKDARAYPGSGGRCGIKAGLEDLEAAFGKLSECEAKLGQTEGKLGYHMHG